MNIVTIDFDIIMGPSIGLYNNLINSETRASDLVKDFPYLNCANADLNTYEFLTRYYINVLKKLDKSKIYFIKSHEQVVPLVSKNRDANLINIDHHHDLGYEIDDWTKPVVGKADCGNWVKKLYDTAVISNYTWYSNPQSDGLLDEAIENYPTDIKLLSECNMNDLIEKTDILIICQSFEWVTPLYQPLFWTWVGIYEEMYGCQYLLIDNN